MKNPEFSIIIPSYNHSKYILDTINSVINQTFKDWELIIVDDGSTDNSVDIIKGINDPRIRFLTQINHDAPYTINRGLKESRGKYIAILNSDDLFELSKLELCHKYLLEGWDFLFGKLNAVDQNGDFMDKSDIRVVWIDQKLNNSKKKDNLEKLLKNINYTVTTSNFVFTRKALEKVGFFHERLHVAHDFDFVLRFYENNLKIKFIPEYLARYRMHSDNTISKGRNLAYLEPAYSISSVVRRNSILKNKILTVISKQPVFSEAVDFLLSLDRDEMEEVVQNKESNNRKMLLKEIDKMLDVSFSTKKGGLDFSKYFLYIKNLKFYKNIKKCLKKLF